MKLFYYFLDAILQNRQHFGYIQSVQQKAVELALTGYNSLAHIPRFNAVFLCVFSPRSRSMVKLEGEAFAPAGDLVNQSVNPFQLCHPHLTVIGKAPVITLGAFNHA